MTLTVNTSGRMMTLGACALGLCLACSGEAASEPCAEGVACRADGQVLVATWWGTRGELFSPFAILQESLRRRNPLEASLAHRLQSKVDHTRWVEEQLDPLNPAPLPLDVFSANNGDEVLRWTPCAAMGASADAPRLLGLTRPELGQNGFKSEWIERYLPREVMQTLQCEGETYALPVGIHRVNTLVYNKSLFRAAGYATGDATDDPSAKPLPTTLDQLHAAAAAIQEHLPEERSASDLQPSVFAVSGREAWTLSLFVIENLMLSLANDAAHYQTYWQGRGCDEGLLERTLEEFARLKPWFGTWELNSSEALNRVRSGQAAMTVTGDWAAAEAEPEEIGTLPFPGTERYFVFTADVFALPDIVSADRWKGLAWLRAVTGDTTQLEFSAAKRALPARTELEGELAPGSPNAPQWVPSLPAILPYHPEGPFAGLQDQLQTWLYSTESDENATASLLEYARGEYPKLAGQSCPDPSEDPIR